MTKLLDFRTSQHASFVGSITIPLKKDIPAMFGTIGLNIAGAEGLLRAGLHAIMTVSISPDAKEDAKLHIVIVRGTKLTDPLVYTGMQTIPLPSGKNDAVHALAAEAADYHVPQPGSGVLVYSAFVVATSDLVRIGPESFKGSVYSD